MINLINVNGRPKSWDEISNEFNLGSIEFLEWNGIIQSIPSNWKESILESFITVFPKLVKQ